MEGLVGGVEVDGLGGGVEKWAQLGLGGGGGVVAEGLGAGCWAQLGWR